MMTPRRQPLASNAQIPCKLGRLTPENVIAEGGSSLVYKARLETKKNSSYVAVKELYPYSLQFRRTTSGDLSCADHELFKTYYDRFQEEYELLKSIRHDKLVRPLELIENNSTLYIVLDWVDGCTLADTIRKPGGAKDVFDVGFISSLLETVGYIHAHKKVHRDLKPSNIMVTPDNVPVILDFGVMRDRANENEHTRMPGNANMAPEAWFPVGLPLNAKADVYSICWTLLYALTGTQPPNADDLREGSEKLQEWASPHRRVRPPELLNILIDGMQPSLEKRIPDVDSLAQRLLPAIEALTSIGPKAKTTNIDSRVPKRISAPKSRGAETRSDSDLADLFLDLVDIPFRFESHYSFQRVVDDDRIKDRLGGDMSMRLKRFLGENTTAYLNWLEQVFGWIEGSPSKEEVVEAYESMYELLPYVEGYSFVNTKGVFPLINYLDGEHGARLCMIVGEFGAGKTFFLNYMLSCHHKKLLDRNLDWFRVDASKIYNVWKEQRNPDAGLPTRVVEYVERQLCWICLTAGSSPTFTEIQDGNEDFLMGLREITTLEVSAEAYKNFVNTIRKLDLEGGALEKKDIAGTLKSRLGISVPEFYSAIKYYFSNAKKDLVLVVDGIDNIDFAANRDAYTEFVEELRERFLSSEHDKGPFEKVVVTVRPSTKTHLDALLAGQYYSRPEIFEIGWVNPREIFLKKSNIVNRPNRYFGKHLKRLEDHENEVFSENSGQHEMTSISGRRIREEFVGFCRAYIDEIESQSKQIIIAGKLQERIPDDKTLEMVLHWNVRALSLNCVHAYGLKLLAERKKKHVSLRNLAFEELVLNGALYVDTKMFRNERWHDNGHIIPNPFWFDEGRCSSRTRMWHGLAGLRILQLLEARGSAVFEEECLEALCTSFDYEKSVVSSALEIFKKYRLVEIEYVPSRQKADQVRKHRTKKDDVERKIAISNKGRFVKALVFNNVNVFYYFALDTPIPYGEFDGEAPGYLNWQDRRLIVSHENSALPEGEIWRRYTEACSKMALTFCRLVHAQQKNEISNYKENALVARRTFLLVPSEDEESKEWARPLVDALRKLWSDLSNISPERLRDLASEIGSLKSYQ